MTDLAIQLYRVDNPDGIWEIQDPQTRYFYLDKARALERGAAREKLVAKPRKDVDYAVLRKNATERFRKTLDVLAKDD